MVLGKLLVPGRPSNFDYSTARAYCAYSRCGWGLFGHFYSRLSVLSSFSLSLGDGPIKTEILSQRAVKPKTTNQLTHRHTTPSSTITRSELSLKRYTLLDVFLQYACKMCARY